MSQKYVVYHFKCDLCDADYVGYTCRHLYQRIEEHLRDQPLGNPSEINMGGTQVTCLLDLLKSIERTFTCQPENYRKILA